MLISPFFRPWFLVGAVRRAMSLRWYFTKRNMGWISILHHHLGTYCLEPCSKHHGQANPRGVRRRHFRKVRATTRAVPCTLPPTTPYSPWNLKIKCARKNSHTFITSRGPPCSVELVPRMAHIIAPKSLTSNYQTLPSKKRNELVECVHIFWGYYRFLDFHPKRSV